MFADSLTDFVFRGACSGARLSLPSALSCAFHLRFRLALPGEEEEAEEERGGAGPPGFQNAELILGRVEDLNLLKR